ncbi:MAG: Jag N-terminal domain-containing protein [Chloroflexi bacterium]|nr:Jag N-terminal domain-containing protein [Chloroflexota bacterium]
MTSKKTIEAKGSDVDSAIAKGLAELGLSREAVAVEIIDEGSRGLFGLGGRPAVVRLTANVVPETIAPPVVTRPAPPPPVAPPPVITPAPRPAPAAKPAAAGRASPPSSAPG